MSLDQRIDDRLKTIDRHDAIRSRMEHHSMGERFVAIGYRGQGIGFNGCVRLFAEENIVEYLDDLGQSGGAAAKNGIAMVNSVEVQRFVNIPRLGKAAGAKAEIPVVVVLIVSEAAEALIKVAMEEQVSRRDRGIEFHEGHAVRCLSQDMRGTFNLGLDARLPGRKPKARVAAGGK